MKIKGTINILFAILYTLAAAGCTDDISRLVPENGNAIRFNIPTSGSGELTRATITDRARYSAFQFENADTWVISEEETLDTDIHTNRRRGFMRNAVAALPSVSGVDNFYILAYVYDGDGDWEDNFGMAMQYIGETVTRSGDGTYSGDEEHYWPGDTYSMKFFGHSFLYAKEESDNAAGSSGESGSVESGSVTIGCRNSSDGAEIRLSKIWPSVKYDASVCNDDLVLTSDIMPDASSSDYLNINYKKTLPGDYNRVVNLHFYHPLTAVTFTADEAIENEITSIEISGIHIAGKHSYGDDNWTFYASDGTEYVKGTLPFQLTLSTESRQHPKMVVPQSLNGATLTVTFANGRKLTKSLAGRSWNMGRRVNYHITDTKAYDEWVVEGLEDMTLSWRGGEIEVPINSYILRSTVHEGTGAVETEVIPVPWSASPQLQEPWINIGTDSGSGDGSGPGATPTEKFTATVGTQEYTYTNEHNDKLRRTPAVSGVYDLSTNGGTAPQSTGNCYLVNAPGTYSLPLVFGNAITNGKINTKAYSQSSINNGGGDRAIYTFKTYDRSLISTPYIYEQRNGNYNDNVNDAVLCWQDAENLVTNIRLDSDKKSLLFDVNAATIKQGNALVAIRDSKQRIMWSWHIWVTDYVLGTDIKVVRNQGVPNGDATVTTNEFLPYNLGHCDEGTYKYEARKDYIVITQSYEGATRQYSFLVTQKEHVFHPTNNTYYQWGRKDPMLPGYFTEDGSGYDPITGRYQINVADKEQFYTDERYKFCMKDAKASSSDLAIAMQNPNVFFTSSDNWCNWMVINLWNGNNGGDVCKTVYDPCPPGYAIPSAKVFTGFTRSGDTVDGIDVTDEAKVEKAFDEDINSYLRSVEDFARNFGFTFYCNPMTGEGVYDRSAGTIYFPTIGYRMGDGSVTTPAEVGHYCFMWSTNPDYGKRAAWYMMFGISETEIKVVPRARDAGDGGIPRNLAHGFSVRAIKEY